MEQSQLELLQQSDDFKKDVLNNGRFQIEVFYFDSVCIADTLKKEIAHPFVLTASAEAFEQVLTSALDCTRMEDTAKLAEQMLAGYAVIRLQDKFYEIKAAKPVNDAAMIPLSESTLQGPLLSFSENAEQNLMFLRRRYPHPELVAEEHKLGKVTKTRAYLVYNKRKANPDLVKQFSQKLDQIDADIVVSAGQIEALITGVKYRWFPTMILTERPDRSVLNLSQGKLVLLLDGTPFVLIAPVVFYDFVSAMDDLYHSYLVSLSFIVLRYISILITTTLPALYVAIVSYNPEIFRVQFALSIAGSRAAVPYPSFIEVLIMLFLIEALIEASLRLPRLIGSTATTVGGLILGQAAQMAGMVSSIMIIVTSVVAISNFLIPVNAMSFAIRIAKYPLILLAALFGVTGVVAGMFALVLYAANLTSFGMPYFRIFIGEPSTSGYKDGEIA